jgi:hypothetical protein
MMALGLLLGSPAIYITTLSVDNQVYIDIKEIVVGRPLQYNVYTLPTGNTL